MMIVFGTQADLVQHLDNLRSQGRRIGLVPTMGALHRGHISLVDRSTGENDITVVSVFVNPTQFNDPEDLEKYPRRPDRDLEQLRASRVEAVFMPPVEEMYPEPDLRVFDLGGLDRVLEGAFRKGHFNGVAQIVSKLFDTVRPDRAYFGRKDFQQLVIIRHLTGLYYPGIKIVDCPIVRERDGLAMSSRNQRLSPGERKSAPFIYRTLQEAAGLHRNLSPEEVKAWVYSAFEQHPEFQLEYFEIVDDKSLNPVSTWTGEGNNVGCIAVYLGKVRLIDNIFFN